jgi:hypothetical protein
MWSECARILNSGACADAECTKFTDIWVECARSLYSGACADAGCAKVNDMWLECARSLIVAHAPTKNVSKFPTCGPTALGL